MYVYTVKKRGKGRRGEKEKVNICIGHKLAYYFKTN
jgi:hypothetical protein